MSRWGDEQGLMWADAVKDNGKAERIVSLPPADWVPPDSLPVLRGKGYQILSLDTETKDPDLTEKGPGFRRGAKVIGISLGLETGYRTYIPFRHEGGGNLDEAKVQRWMKEELNQFDGELVGANINYDLDGLENEGVTFPNVKIIHDVQVAEPLIDEWRLQYNLDVLSHDYLGVGKEQALLDRAAMAYGWQTERQRKSNIFKLHSSYVGPYAEADADRPLRILPLQLKKLAEENQLPIYELERNLIRILVAMRRRGVRIDVHKAELVKVELEKQRVQWLAEARRLAGSTKVEFMQPETFVKALEARGLKIPLTPKTKQPSIKKDFLERYQSDELVNAIFQGRKINTTINTFIDGHILGSQIKGRIHCQFNQLKGDDSGTIARFCVHGDTTLDTSRGKFKIKDYEPTGQDTILTHRGRQRKILRKFYKGREEMFKTFLSNGSMVICTKAHRLLTPTGWKSLRDIQIGEKVISYGSLQNTPGKSIFSEKSFTSLLGSSSSHHREPCQRDWNHHSNTRRDLEKRITSGPLQSRKSPSLLSQQDGQKEPHDWQSRKAAPQLQRSYFGRPRLSTNQSEWKVYSIPCSSYVESFGLEETAQRVCGSSHRRKSRTQQTEQLRFDYHWRAPSFTPETVEAVTSMGTADVWDIEVEEDHSYCAEGLVHHNSSSNPNLQNIPARDEILAPLIRGIFIPEDGERWAKADYSQVEYRLLTHFAIGQGAEDARRRYNEDPETDFHKYVALGMGIDPEDSFKRKRVKNINFAGVYGARGLRLSQLMNSSIEEATEFLEKYKSDMPFVFDTFEACQKWMKKQGYVTTIYGRRQRCSLWEPFNNWGEDIKPPLPYEQAVKEYGHRIQRFMTYAALNRKLQGSGADIMKLAMVNAWKAGVCNVIGPFLLTVHDELDSSIPQNKKGQEANRELISLMESAVQMKVPLLVDNEEGTNWGDCK